MTLAQPCDMPDPRRIKELRKFGLLVGGCTIGLFGLVFPLAKRGLDVKHLPLTPWILGAVLICFALVRPQSLGLIERLWMALGEKLGKFNTKIIISVLYWVLIVPIAFAFRALSKSSMDRSTIQKDIGTYRVPTEAHNDRRYFETPF